MAFFRNDMYKMYMIECRFFPVSFDFIIKQFLSRKMVCTDFYIFCTLRMPQSKKNLIFHINFGMHKLERKEEEKNT